MSKLRIMALAAVLMSGAIAPKEAGLAEYSMVAQAGLGDLSGVHDFDFLFGTWRVHHRIQRPAGTGPWVEFEGTCTEAPLMGGRGNVEEHTFNRSTGVTYGVAVRAYDSQTADWAIWWVDSRAPHNPMDPPMKGRFKDGLGTFYSDSTLDGKPINVRFLWSSTGANTARWEQAYSDDGGKTWATNWIMEFTRQEA